MTISSSTRFPPYPSSAVIKSVSFAPSSQIMKEAEGSDNWPITWKGDDVLFTAYGDGWGFEPPVDKKLSLGLAEVMGLPPDFHGVNIRSPSGEHLGDGIKGPWTTAFFTERWDCGDTHGYRLPSKWISEDGTTMYLVFLGL